MTKQQWDYFGHELGSHIHFFLFKITWGAKDLRSLSDRPAVFIRRYLAHRNHEGLNLDDSPTTKYKTHMPWNSYIISQVYQSRVF